jgi:hypothetical protein
MDEGRKRVLGIMAAILTSIHICERRTIYLAAPLEVLARIGLSPLRFNGLRRSWKKIDERFAEKA